MVPFSFRCGCGRGVVSPRPRRLQWVTTRPAFELPDRRNLPGTVTTVAATLGAVVVHARRRRSPRRPDGRASPRPLAHEAPNRVAEGGDLDQGGAHIGGA